MVPRCERNKIVETEHPSTSIIIDEFLPANTNWAWPDSTTVVGKSMSCASQCDEQTLQMKTCKHHKSWHEQVRYSNQLMHRIKSPERSPCRCTRWGQGKHFVKDPGLELTECHGLKFIRCLVVEVWFDSPGNTGKPPKQKRRLTKCLPQRNNRKDMNTPTSKSIL